MQSKYLASVHSDYYPFIALATDEELGRFVRAQICQAIGEEMPELTGVAKALFDTHTALAERLEASSRAQSENGKKGGAPKGNRNAKKSTQNNPKQPPLDFKTSENKPVTITDTDTVTNTVTNAKNEKKKGAKAPQKENFADFVSMTNDEYSSLVAKVGERGALRCIEILDNYKGANGKKYASDYRAILNWVVQRYTEETAASGGAYTVAGGDKDGDSL